MLKSEQEPPTALIESGSEKDSILPIAITFSSDLKFDSHLNPVLTRFKAKTLGITIPDIYLSKFVRKGPVKRSLPSSVPPSHIQGKMSSSPLPLSRSQAAIFPPPNIWHGCSKL